VTETWQALHTRHSRNFRDNKFVYPVLSRRSRGISIGVNLNPDKVCNFDCVYCQVDRRSEATTTFVETDRLLQEVDHMLSFVSSGDIFKEPEFSGVPPERQRLNDVAFSGDGEPTSFRNFDALIETVAGLKRQHALPEVKLVLITNASLFHRPVVERGLQILDRNNGEIWAKLDAGTDAYYQTIERTKIPFRRVLDNITAAAKVRPIVIQSLFLRLNGVPPDQHEIDEYCRRLQETVAAGGQIRLVQVYTVARPPAESYVTPLTAGELEAIARQVCELGLPAEVYAA